MILAQVAVPLEDAVKYVGAAYAVFLALILVYVAIMAARLSRLEQDLVALGEQLDAPPEVRDAHGTVPGTERAAKEPVSS